ncbi:hypothetical protein GCM10027089_31120 [Nocardia thraciensis]
MQLVRDHRADDRPGDIGDQRAGLAQRREQQDIRDIAGPAHQREPNQLGENMIAPQVLSYPAQPFCAYQPSRADHGVRAGSDGPIVAIEDHAVPEPIPRSRCGKRSAVHATYRREPA